MAKSYIELINEFNQWLESGTLPVNSQLMYFKILNIFNRAGWPEYVQVDNLRLMSMIGSQQKKTAMQARDKLVEAGFITYDKGRKGCPNCYRLGYRCENYTINDTISYTTNDTINDTISYTTNDTHIKTKTKTKDNTPVLPNGNTAPTKKFSPPSVDEVLAYCLERKNSVDPQRFVDFYTSNGWKVGKNPMKDWKASVRTWEKEAKTSQPVGRVKKDIPQGCGNLGEAELEAIRRVLEG